MDANRDGRGAQLARDSVGMFVAELVGIPNVEVVHETSTSVWCRADGPAFYVPRKLLFGDELQKVGDWGVLVVPDWFAREQGFGG